MFLCFYFFLGTLQIIGVGKEAEPLSPQCSLGTTTSSTTTTTTNPLNNDSSTTTTHLSPRTACQQPTPRRTQIMESSSSNNNGSSSSMITIHLSLTSSPTSPRINLAIDSGGSISALELQTQVSEATNIPPSRLRLIYGGRVVVVQAPRPPPPPSERPQNVLVEYGIVDGSVVHVVAGPTESAVDARTATGNARSMAGLASLVDTTSTTTSSSSNNNSSTLPCTFDNNFNANNNTTSSSSSLTEALITLQTNNNAHVYHTALATSNKIFTNIITHVR